MQNPYPEPVALHYRSLSVQAPNDRLADDRSPQRHASLILAHGFTQNGDCWGPFGQLLAQGRPVLAVDLPGHGRSGHDDADLPTAGMLLGAAGGSGVYVGYSMGGRVALHTALAYPQSVRGLVLIGATAGLDQADDRATRRAADDELARRLLGVGLPRFLDGWLANPLFAGLDDRAAAREQRLKNRIEGLAASLRNCGTGTQQPLWNRLEELTMPVLIVVGDQDHKFTTIGQRMAAAMSGANVELVSIPGTHAVHLERPEETAKIVLGRVDGWATAENRAR